MTQENHDAHGAGFVHLRDLLPAAESFTKTHERRGTLGGNKQLSLFREENAVNTYRQKAFRKDWVKGDARGKRERREPADSATVDKSWMPHMLAEKLRDEKNLAFYKFAVRRLPEEIFPRRTDARTRCTPAQHPPLSRCTLCQHRGAASECASPKTDIIATNYNMILMPIRYPPRREPRVLAVATIPSGLAFAVVQPLGGSRYRADALPPSHAACRSPAPCPSRKTNGADDDRRLARY